MTSISSSSGCSRLTLPTKYPIKAANPTRITTINPEMFGVLAKIEKSV